MLLAECKCWHSTQNLIRVCFCAGHTAWFIALFSRWRLSTIISRLLASNYFILRSGSQSCESTNKGPKIVRSVRAATNVTVDFTMTSTTKDLTKELIDDIWKLEALRWSETRRLDLGQLYSTVLKVKCNLLESSIQDEIPITLFVQLAQIKWLSQIFGLDSNKLDVHLKRGLRDALLRLSGSALYSNLFSMANLELLYVCARLLELGAQDLEWRNLETLYREIVAQLSQKAGVQ